MLMKFSTKHFINRIKNHSLKGLTHLSNILVNKFTLSVLKNMYKEGAIQSLIIHPQSLTCSMFLVTVNLRIVGGNSVLQNIKTFNPVNSSVKLKNLDRLVFKQVTFFVSATKGISTPLHLKRTRSGGTLLLSF